MLIEIYTTVLYQPLYNLLIFFYNTAPGHDLGIAILFLTIVVKLILYPFFTQSVKAQKALANLQPKIDELNKKYKNQKDQLGRALMELYKKEKVNPFSSCLPLIIQMPFLIAVFQVFRHGLNNGSLELLYSIIPNPGSINTISLGIIDLSNSSFILAIFAGIAQFWQSKMILSRKTLKSSSNSMAANMNKQMIYIMPLITVFIGSSLPAGLTLYWFLTTVFGGLQQLLIFRKTKEEPEKS
jgi:YidC/Oxa1 family membrane protein insertase